MSDVKPQGTDTTNAPGKPSTLKQKCIFVGKVIVFLITFGFAFPHLFGD